MVEGESINGMRGSLAAASDYPMAVVDDLSLPPCEHYESDEENFAWLAGRTCLRNLSLPISVDELIPDKSSLAKSCSALVATLPNLQGLWLASDYQEFYEAEDFAPAALQIAQSGPALSYIRIDEFSWKVTRYDKVTIVLLTNSEDENASPEPFDRWAWVYDYEGRRSN